MIATTAQQHTALQQVETPAPPPRPLHPLEIAVEHAKLSLVQAQSERDRTRAVLNEARLIQEQLNAAHDSTLNALRAVEPTLSAIDNVAALQGRLAAIDLLANRAKHNVRLAEDRVHWEGEHVQKCSAALDFAQFKLDEFRNT